MQEKLKSFSPLSGSFKIPHWEVLEVAGPDAGDFLHRLSSADVKKLPQNQATLAAFLTGKGTLIGFGYLYRNAESFYIISGPHQAERLSIHLEQFHFQEKLVIQRKMNFAVILTDKYDAPEKSMSWQDAFNPNWKWILGDEEKALSEDFPFNRFHALRIKWGMPYWGWEVFEGDLVLEAGLEKAVARNKGCYPGQEVVERIFTYGQVNWKLLRVELRSDSPITTGPCDLSVSFEGKEVGQLRSMAAVSESTTLGWGLARLRKEVWREGSEMEVGSGLCLKVREEE